MDVQDSEEVHSSSESGVQSLKLFDGSLDSVPVSDVLVSAVFSPHARRRGKNIFIGVPWRMSTDVS